MTTRTLFQARHALTCGAALGIVLGAGCDDLTPATGRLQATTTPCTAVASGGYGAYGGTTTAVTCPDGGATTGQDAGSLPDTGTNTIVPDAGVTGNVLIADQYNNRIIEVTRAGDIVWSFGDGSSVPGPSSIVGPNDAERLPNGQTLMAGTGAPQGAEPTCSGNAGCVDNRVLIVDDSSGAIVWQYGTAGVTGNGPNQLSGPATAVLVPTSGGNDVLITDQGNQRILEVSQATKKTVWQFPPASPSADQMLVAPNSAQRLTTGNTLITDQGGNRILEVDTTGNVVWQYPTVVDTASLDTPAFASRLPNGNTLITDSNNKRVIEVDSYANVAWTYDTTKRSASGNGLPTRAVRLANGHTLITESFDDQVIEIDENKNVVYTHGQLGAAGSAGSLLNQPYDAKVVGDYTGLTPPTL
jgi:hypothetical protein